MDNFNSTYKLLLYRVIVTAITLCLYTAVIFSFLQIIMDTTQIEAMSEAIGSFTRNFVELNYEGMQSAWLEAREALNQIINMLTTRLGEIIGGVIVILVVYLIEHFFLGLGNYTLGAMINDKMAMHANSPFFGTLVKNLGKAALYNVIYVPLSFAFDVICILIMWALFFLAFTFLPLLVQIFLFVTMYVLLTALKMTFTTDWLPSLIYGKKNNREAMAYSFTRKGKNSLGIFSNLLILILIIFAINSAALAFTIGAGFLITLPASYVLLVSFEFVNYCDHNNIKYFIDKNTVVKPEKEHALTREEFFRGEK